MTRDISTGEDNVNSTGLANVTGTYAPSRCAESVTGGLRAEGRYVMHSRVEAGAERKGTSSIEELFLMLTIEETRASHEILLPALAS